MEAPCLRNMMNSYFHQDYDLDGDDDAAILRTFVRTSDAEVVRSTLAELQMLLHMSTDGLLERFVEMTGRGNMLIAEDDAGAVAWLRAAAATLAASAG